MLWLLPELLEGAEQAVTVAPATSANLTVLLLAYSFNRAVSTAHLRSLVLSLLLANERPGRVLTWLPLQDMSCPQY